VSQTIPTQTVRAESLRNDDTIVKRFGFSTLTWPIESVTVKGVGNTAVGVRCENGQTLGYSRSEPVTVAARNACDCAAVDPERNGHLSQDCNALRGAA
jgi:hypothetical protein